MEVKFCKDCKWSRKSKTSYDLRCINPHVMSKDSHALSANISVIDEETVNYNYGKSCWSEREVKWFAKCGMKGKLWEQKKVKSIPPGDE